MQTNTECTSILMTKSDKNKTFLHYATSFTKLSFSQGYCMIQIQKTDDPKMRKDFQQQN